MIKNYSILISVENHQLVMHLKLLAKYTEY